MGAPRNRGPALVGAGLVSEHGLSVHQHCVLGPVGLGGTIRQLHRLIGLQWTELLSVTPQQIPQSAVPTETMEAARIDGAGELRIFRSIGLPLMVPGMVTVFPLTFVGIWNNFLLPYIMLSNQDFYPLTVGLYTLLSKGSGSPQLYTLAITGAAIAVIPLIALVMLLQKYWRLDLVSGGIKG